MNASFDRPTQELFASLTAQWMQQRIGKVEDNGKAEPALPDTAWCKLAAVPSSLPDIPASIGADGTCSAVPSRRAAFSRSCLVHIDVVKLRKSRGCLE